MHPAASREWYDMMECMGEVGCMPMSEAAQHLFIYFGCAACCSFLPAMPSSPKLADVGFTRNKAKGDGDCYPLSAMAGFEISATAARQPFYWLAPAPAPAPAPGFGQRQDDDLSVH